jgi:hypothetical protein
VEPIRATAKSVVTLPILVLAMTLVKSPELSSAHAVQPVPAQSDRRSSEPIFCLVFLIIRAEPVVSSHGLINYIDTKAKCHHLKKLTCKGTLRQVFIRVDRLDIRSVMLVFPTQLCDLLPL